MLVIAALAVAALLSAPDGASAQRPGFAWRGIIEGYYGTAWSHPDRMRILRWMGRRGMNAYVRAPKGDVYQSWQWRSPYPARVQAQFDQEIAFARARGVQWIPNLSPAQPNPGSPNRVCFSCPADVTALIAKLRPFIDAGARTVMVSFDDIPKAFSSADAAAFGAAYPGQPVEYQFGRATTSFLNAVRKQLPASIQLLTVLTDYVGVVDTPYLRGIREGRLDPRVGVMWTGPRIRFIDFTAADAAAYGRLIGRTPIVWANWANHDVTPSRLFLGPFQKANDVAGAVQGFFFNPLNEADLNMLPLATAANWMTAPDLASYSPRRSWKRAVRLLAGRRRSLREQLTAWAETSYSTTLGADEAPAMTRKAGTLLAQYGDGGDWMRAADRLVGELDLVRRAAFGLRKLPNRRIARQALPFLAASRQAALAGEQGVELLAALRPSITVERSGDGFAGRVTPPDPGHAWSLRQELELEWWTTRASTLQVYGCRTMARGCPGGGSNHMDDFLEQVVALHDQWVPQSDRAGRSVRLRLGGRRVRHSRQGDFQLPAKACGRRLVAVDGAGDRTELRLPRCR